MMFFNKKEKKTYKLIGNLLYNKSENERSIAAEDLSKVGGKEVVAELIHVLKNDKSWSVKFSAAEALEKIGLPSIDALIDILNDKDAKVRQLSISALGGIADKRSIEPLISFLQDLDPEVQRRAKKALEKICLKYHLDYQTLLQQAQSSIIKEVTEEKTSPPSQDIIQYIKKLKGLLDIGAITQEEFERKKKQLLDRI